MSHPPTVARPSVMPTDVTTLQETLTALYDTLNKKDRELDTTMMRSKRQAAHLRTLLGHYMLRQHIRTHKQKRILMNTHLTATQMKDLLNTTEIEELDKQQLPSQQTLRKLANLYRKRPLHITAELDDCLTHEIKDKFIIFFHNYQRITRDNESLFKRNVELTADGLTSKEALSEERKEKEEYKKLSTEKAHALNLANRELEELRKKLAKMEKDEETKKKKEAAKAMQERTAAYSKALQQNAPIIAYKRNSLIHIDTEPSSEIEEKQTGEITEIQSQPIVTSNAVSRTPSTLPPMITATLPGSSLSSPHSLSPTHPYASERKKKTSKQPYEENLTLSPSNISPRYKKSVTTPNSPLLHTLHSPSSSTSSFPAIMSPSPKSKSKSPWQ